jgi:hypothetical protein
VSLEEELSAAGEAAQSYAGEGEEVAAVIPAEPGSGARVYLCAYERAGERTWLALDAEGAPVVDRTLVRDAVAIAALVELAEESAGGGNVGELRAQLVELRLTDNPEGIEEAEVAAAEVQAAIKAPPRVASVPYLDELGTAAAKLEGALGQIGASPFAEAMKTGVAASEELADDVESRYKLPLA